MNDTTLREHQHCMGLTDSKICEEADGIEEAYHFFFQCTKYSDSRDKMKQDIQRIWTVSGRDGSPSWSVALLLAPFTVTAHQSTESRYTGSNIWIHSKVRPPALINHKLMKRIQKYSPLVSWWHTSVDSRGLYTDTAPMPILPHADTAPCRARRGRVAWRYLRPWYTTV